MEINTVPAALREHNQIEKLSANRWFARRFHMLDQFGWRLPLAPTEKKLQLSMNIALGRYEGLLMFDHSFISIYQNFKFRHPSQEKLNSEPSNLAKFIVIGKKKDDFFKGKESLTLQDKTFDIEVKENEPYLEVYCKPENATALLTQR